MMGTGDPDPVQPPPDPARIRAARAAIDPVFLDTPLRRFAALDRALGLPVVFKDETANPIRCFKGRGACALIARLPPGQPLVTASAGNFGQAVAWAATRRGMPVTVFAARTAVPAKLDAMRALGATLVLVGEDFDAAKAAAREHAVACGALFVEDGAHAAIAEGAGTLAAELTDRDAAFDTLLLPLGNGALAAGVGCWLRHARPDVRIVAVTASGAPAMRDAVCDGTLAERSAATIADGIAVRVPIPYAVDTVRAVVDDVIAVDDDAIRAAMRRLRSLCGLTVEPAAAVPLAAVLADPSRWQGRSLATVLTGANADPALLATLDG